MTDITGHVPPGAREITTGQTNRVWHIDGPTPYVLKHYPDPRRAANEAAALTLLARHHAPAPRLLATGPAWTAQTAVHAHPVPAQEFLDVLAELLPTVHHIPGPHAGRLTGMSPFSSWPAYLHDRLDHYTRAAPGLTHLARPLHHELDTLPLDQHPRLLHHDLQPGHLVHHHTGPLLLDWELAAYGDPLSDLARLAVRLQLPHPTDVTPLVRHHDRHTGHRLVLYWRIHQLADAALTTDPDIRHRAYQNLGLPPPQP